MRKRMALAIVASAALALVVRGGGDRAWASPIDPKNPLIGHWRFSAVGADTSAAPGGCATAMTFTRTQWTLVQASGTTASAVIYYASPKMVYVVNPEGGHVTYNVLDPDHIQLDTFALCTYTRVG